MVKSEAREVAFAAAFAAPATLAAAFAAPATLATATAATLG
jgi:hypothetical protein